MNEELEALLERWPLGALFDLPPLSTVVVIGAYKGVTMELLDELYHPAAIYGFEPQDWAAQEASNRLRGRGNCAVYNCALGINEDKYTMGEWGTDACSLVNTGPESREHGTVQMFPAELYFDKISHSDLVVINIEGYEYTLLSHLRQHSILPTIDRLAIQWHLGLQPDGQVTEEIMDRHIDRLFVEDEFLLKHDERPSWTLHVKAAG